MAAPKSELFLRYERACHFDRPVDEEKVTVCLKQFFTGLGVPVTVRRISSFKDVKASRAAGAARAALDARAARAAWDAWDASVNAVHLIGATQIQNQKQIQIWTPYFEAFEAGCWVTFHLDSEILWLPLPKLRTNARNQCHADGQPAVSLPGEQWYFLNGICMDEWMVMTPAEQIAPQKILEVANADQRRELLRKVGIERFVATVGAKALDTQGDYTLLSIDFNGGPRTYLKMRNPSIGVWHVEGISNECKTVEQALRWRQPEAMQAIPVSEDGEKWFQQGDVMIWPKDAKTLQPVPSILT